MVVMILERVNQRLRGELSRWLIEPHTGVFVGHVNGMVRDKLWEKCCEASCEGGVVQMWNSNNEQRFQMRMWGFTTRRVVDFEGLQLIEIPSDQSG
jgi:CRISPR-associated protein Cas2